MLTRVTLLVVASAALLLTGCFHDDEPSITPPPSASPSASPPPSPSPSLVAEPEPEPTPTPVEPGEGEGENDPGPGYIDTSFVYPAVLVDESTIPPGDLDDYVHFAFLLQATATTAAPQGVTHHVCAASFSGFHGCVDLDIGDTLVPLDVYVEPGYGVHLGVSDSGTPMAGAFYYVDMIDDQPSFTAGTDILLELRFTFDDTQNDFGIFLPSMLVLD